MSQGTVSRKTVLRIRDLAVTLPSGGDRPLAVNGVDLSITAGETLCLVGESGSGKSVIAHAVMGLLPKGLRIARGRIELLGDDIAAASPARLRELRARRMSMVFQEPMTALNPVMRCGSQVDEVLRAHTTLAYRERRRRILEIFERVQLPDPARVYEAYPHQLSGGQRQRIVIALALVLDPALLICDEPTTALDVTTQAEILSLIRERQTAADTAVLFITHDFGVVADIADSVAVLRLGDQVEHGRRDQVLCQPRDPYTRMLISAVPSLAPPERTESKRSAPILELKSIGKKYIVGAWPRRRDIEAVAEVSLSLSEGETVGIVGESGSGKSTVARCVARLIDPSAGDLLLDGMSYTHARGSALSRVRRSIQMVFQDPYRSLDPRQTIGDSIVEGAVNFGVPSSVARARAADLMALVQMSAAALSRYPNEFSGGQRQRICIARALACEPRILVADEAVSALDVSVQAQILRLLEDIKSRLNLSLLFITHDLRVAAQICDRVIVMKRGRIVEEGVTNRVYEEPKNEYTRRLLLAAPGRDFQFSLGWPVAVEGDV